MSFVSIQFLLFLPIVFLLYWFVFKQTKWQNLFIVGASYVFYGWWDWRFLLLMAFTSVCCYTGGLLIEKYEGNRRMQKGITAANVVVNLAILGVFKYYNFFVDNLDLLLRNFGMQVDWPTANIILPVGISFYTFQAIGYCVDVYKKKVEASRNPVEFFAFISFFPQLVAGPIEKASDMLPQFAKARTFDYARAVDGSRQMLWGMFKKVVIADNCAPIVNSTWEQVDSTPGINLMLAMVLFSFQVYCDFSGYCDIAVGCAKLFGFKLRSNFNYPYFSRNIPEFWRRWHITLLSWFRDYVYFPLGGSRCSKLRCCFNTTFVFVLSGLWHGPDWSFVCYGCAHGLMCSFFVLTGIKTKYEHNVGWNRLLPSVKEVAMMAGTFALVTLCRVMFRAQSMGEAVHFYQHMFNPSTFVASDLLGVKVLALCFLLLVIEWTKRNSTHVLELSGHGLMRYRVARWALYAGLTLAITFGQSAQQDFIYFQF